MKLYPPYIEGKLPAFTEDEIIIPFQLNPLVGENDFDGLALFITSMSGQQIGETLYSSNCAYENNQFRVTFTIGDNSLFHVGQFYKMQLACTIDKEDAYEVGYYSSVGVAKRIIQPQTSIKFLSADKVTSNPITFIGEYSYEHEIDKEKIYSYCFNVYDDKEQLYDTSGDIVYNNEAESNSDTQECLWTLNKTLEENKIYSIEYAVTTQNYYDSYLHEANGLTRYQIIEGLYEPSLGLYGNFKFYVPNSKANDIVELDSDNGKVNIRGYSTTPMNGTYKLVRTCSEDEYKTWVDISEFVIAGDVIPKGKLMWSDYTIKCGLRYKYAIQRYNKNGVRAERYAVTQPITADFNDMFLYDGERQLRLAFNPKISSFKTTILESKSDTLGGPYPFFYRNGNIAYKDFPISGLISLNMDQNFEFFDEKKANAILNPENEFVSRQRRSAFSNDARTCQVGTSLTLDTLTAEREFRVEVLDWLNNGQVKLFRSPTEGNYVVRLMNISLSPNDTLGRMIYSFNANAYEVDKSDTNSLIKKQIFAPKVQKLNRIEEVDVLVTSDPEIVFSKDSKYIQIEIFNSTNLVKLVGSSENDGGNIGTKISAKYQRWDDLDIDDYHFEGLDNSVLTYCNIIRDKLIVTENNEPGKIDFEKATPHSLVFKETSGEDVPYIITAIKAKANDNIFLKVEGKEPCIIEKGTTKIINQLASKCFYKNIGSNNETPIIYGYFKENSTRS